MTNHKEKVEEMLRGNKEKKDSESNRERVVMLGPSVIGQI